LYAQSLPHPYKEKKNTDIEPISQEENTAKSGKTKVSQFSMNHGL